MTRFGNLIFQKNVWGSLKAKDDTTVCTTKVTITFFANTAISGKNCLFIVAHSHITLAHNLAPIHIFILAISTHQAPFFLRSPRYVNEIHQIPRKTHSSQRRGQLPPFLHHSEFFYMLLTVDRFPTHITYVCKI